MRMQLFLSRNLPSSSDSGPNHRSVRPDSSFDAARRVGLAPRDGHVAKIAEI